MRPLVSIVTTFYNSVSLGDFVQSAMQCLLQQTYENLEFICVNDGSLDTTLSELEEFQKKDSRIKIFTKKNQKYAQYSKAYGQEKATGEYIFLFDHDDLIEEDCIEKAMQIFLNNPEVDIVTPMVLAKFTDGKIKYLSNFDIYIQDRKDFTPRLLSGKETIQKTVGKYDIHIRGLYRSQTFKSHSFNFTEPLLNADEIVERKIFEEARFIASCDSVYTHYIHSNSSAKSLSLKQIDIVRTDLLLRELFKSKNIYESRSKIFENTANRNLINAAKTFAHFEKSLSKEEKEKQLNRIKESFAELDKKKVLAQKKGLSKVYNAFLLSNLSLFLNFYRIKS